MNGQERKGNWIPSSGGLHTYHLDAVQDVKDRIYGKGNYAVFLSHLAHDKGQVAKIKENLAAYGISCFVAHEDIAPNTQWANEIMDALYSADLLVALMSSNFHKSDWTDHEIGCAIGRGIPVIAMNIGSNPYGILAQFQGYKSTWETAATDLLKLLCAEEKYHQVWVRKVGDLGGYEAANEFASKTFPFIKKLSNENISALIKYWATNSQAYESYAFRGWMRGYGEGLADYIVRWDPENFPNVQKVHEAFNDAKRLPIGEI